LSPVTDWAGLHFCDVRQVFAPQSRAMTNSLSWFIGLR